MVVVSPDPNGQLAGGLYTSASGDVTAVRKANPRLWEMCPRPLCKMQTVTLAAIHSQIPHTDPNTGDIVVTSTKNMSDNTKWVLVYDHYALNPNYVRPWYDIGLDGIVSAEVTAFSIAATPAAPILTARGTGLLNSNNIIRWGFNWKGSAMAGRTVFRLAIGSWHIIDF
jgi:hypothetical protein